MSVKELKEIVNKYINLVDAEAAEWYCENVLMAAFYEDYESTYSFIENITKEEMEYVAGCFAEIVEHFQNPSIIPIMRSKYLELIGKNEVDWKEIEILEDFIH